MTKFHKNNFCKLNHLKYTSQDTKSIKTNSSKDTWFLVFSLAIDSCPWAAINRGHIVRSRFFAIPHSPASHVFNLAVLRFGMHPLS